MTPVESLEKVWHGVLGSSLGLSEVGVTMIPLLLTALATAIPTRVGLVNVGGEGQLYVGALTATGVALYFPVGQTWLMLPVMALAGCAGGGAWAGHRGPAETLARRERSYLHPPSQLHRDSAGRLVRVRPLEEPRRGLATPTRRPSISPPSFRPSPVPGFTGASWLWLSRWW